MLGRSLALRQMKRITKQRMIDVLGSAPKPKRVWQRQFDGDDEKLRELAQRDWDDIPDADWWQYFLDLTYVELQPELFRHLFPACLKYWYETLLRDESTDRGDADFHSALVKGDVIAEMLNNAERERLYEFFVDGFLDRLGLERGFRYEPGGNSANRWIGRFNALGLLAPITSRIWRRWWRFDSPGQCVSAIMYASGLIYRKGENPIYGDWTPTEGGGGPYLFESDANLYDHVWLAPNLTFLREILSADYVTERVAAAAERLAHEPEAALAVKVAGDARTRADVISARIGSLVANLARPPLQQDRWE